MNEDHLKSYEDVGFKKVQGWCSGELFRMVRFFDALRINKKGGCLEIGVHHGKLFILLNQVISRDFRSFAVDVFDDQHLNIDDSGRGSLTTFEQNLELYDRHKGQNVTIIEGDSTDQSVIRSEIGNACLRLISIDGGHTVEHTINDLVLANDLVSNEGVVILDDIANVHWLGVTEGAYRFLDRRPTLVPFAIGHNKLYLAKLSYRNFYCDALVEQKLTKKTTDFCGWKIAVV